MTFDFCEDNKFIECSETEQEVDDDPKQVTIREGVERWFGTFSNPTSHSIQ